MSATPDTYKAFEAWATTTKPWWVTDLSRYEGERYHAEETWKAFESFAAGRGSVGAAAEQPDIQPVLVRDVAEVLGASVPAVCMALKSLGRPERSTNMAVSGEELLALQKRFAPPETVNAQMLEALRLIAGVESTDRALEYVKGIARAAIAAAEAAQPEPAAVPEEPVFHLRSYGDVTAAELERLTQRKPTPQPAPAGVVEALKQCVSDMEAAAAFIGKLTPSSGAADALLYLQMRTDLGCGLASARAALAAADAALSHPAPAAPVQGAVATLLGQAKALADETLRQPGRPVPVPQLLADEGRKFMRDEPSLFDALTLKQLNDVTRVTDAAGDTMMVTRTTPISADTCPECGKWRGAHATLPGQPRDHLCRCTPASPPPPVQAVPLTDEQINRHTMPASSCPPDSQVMLVSSIKRILGITGDTNAKA